MLHVLPTHIINILAGDGYDNSMQLQAPRAKLQLLSSVSGGVQFRVGIEQSHRCSERDEHLPTVRDWEPCICNEV